MEKERVSAPLTHVESTLQVGPRGEKGRFGHSHIRRELVQRLVEIIHLDQDAHNHHDRKAVRRRVGELIIAVQRELERDAESFDAHHRDRADETADRDVDQRRAFAVSRDHAPDHKDREGEHEGAVEHEACELQREEKRNQVRTRTGGMRVRTTYSKERLGRTLTRLQRIIQNLIHRPNLLILRRVQDDNDRAHQTKRAADTT